MRISKKPYVGINKDTDGGMTVASRIMRDAWAVGVIRRADGRVLIAERPVGKAMAGYREPPGGKMEPGDAPHEALARELHEEPSIDIGNAQLRLWNPPSPRFRLPCLH